MGLSVELKSFTAWEAQLVSFPGQVHQKNTIIGGGDSLVHTSISSSLAPEKTYNFIRKRANRLKFLRMPRLGSPCEGVPISWAEQRRLLFLESVSRKSEAPNPEP